jgi:hypothetical protein
MLRKCRLKASPFFLDELLLSSHGSLIYSIIFVLSLDCTVAYDFSVPQIRCHELLEAYLPYIRQIGQIA